ncbi:MAG TPA: hypothetical protein VHG33_06830 [Woeseiaceae bacterium]|nr:hypothetical protein [Woeseiaceae bacterium]
MHKRSSFIALFCCVLLSAEALAERTPARLGSGKDSLPSLVEFPELKGDTEATIRCAAIVEENGNLDMNGCFAEDPADQLFIEAIVEAAEDARARPAVADGDEKKVYLQYRVRFLKKGSEQTVNVYPNPGVQENIDAYGQDHVAAQRVVGKEKWQDECPENSRYLVWLKAHVAPDGQQSSLSLAHGGGLDPTPRCKQAILDTVAGSLFFPALADGEPVPSTYVEPFSN